MKNIILLFLVFFSSFAIAQNWASAGAKWHYSYFNNFATEGYVEIKKTGDTIINGKISDILLKTSYTYNYVTAVNDTLILGKEYTYSDSGIVYYFRNSQFYTLYDFNAPPGSGWLVPAGGCSSDSIIVDSTTTTVINSSTLKKLFIHSKYGQYILGSPVIEKIGSMGYMFPEINCVTDLNEGGDLRCYTDSSNWFYDTGIANSCDYITGIAEKKNESDLINIFPNPATNEITLRVEKAAISTLIIRGAAGEAVLVSQFLSSTKVDVSSLPAGIYFAEITSGNSVVRKKICIVR